MNNSSQSLSSRFTAVRSLTVSLTDTLATEDTVIQSMPDVSPTKWHLATKASSQQFYGVDWEWTSSSYAPYPEFKPLIGFRLAQDGT